MAQERSGTRRGLRAWSAASLAVVLLVATAAMAADSALVLAQKAMKSGKPDIALRALNAAISGTDLKGNDIARAYYFRGLANSRSGNKAAAIADLSQSLWLKGLSDAERKDATAAKAALYQQAGLSAPVQEPEPAPEVEAVKKPRAVATDPAPENTLIQPESVDVAVAEPAPPAEEPSVKSTGWNAKSAVAKQRPAKLVKVVPAPKTAARSSTASAKGQGLPWSATEVANADAPQAADVQPSPEPIPVATTEATDNPVNSLLDTLFGGSAQPQAAAADTPAARTAPEQVASSTGAVTPARGGLYLQVASLRSPSDAKELAAKLVAEQSDILGDVKTGVQPVVLGNMGTFYAVRVGPVASADAGNSLCEKLRGKGVDCFVASP